jgi:hypothetical protein
MLWPQNGLVSRRLQVLLILWKRSALLARIVMNAESMKIRDMLLAFKDYPKTFALSITSLDQLSDIYRFS